MIGPPSFGDEQAILPRRRGPRYGGHEMRQLIIVALVFAVASACTPSRKEAWHESGESWKESGQQVRRALGESIAGEGSPKQEWKEVGSDLKQAGQDTGKALGKSIEPADSPTPTR